MKSNKRLATLSLIIMALVSMPRAVQQLGHSINAAQERAGLVWWNLLLTPDAQAAENTDAPLNPCPRPQLIAANTATTPASNPFLAKNNSRAASTRPRLFARTTQGQAASDSLAGSELALNNNSKQNEFDNIQTPAWDATPVEMPQKRETPQKLASHAGPQTGQVWTSAKIQNALASLNQHDAPIAPPDIHIVSDMYANEFAALPSMNALLTTLAKKGLNVQFRMRKALDRNPSARPRARTLISKDADALPLHSNTQCQCPAI